MSYSVPMLPFAGEFLRSPLPLAGLGPFTTLELVLLIVLAPVQRAVDAVLYLFNEQL